MFQKDLNNVTQEDIKWLMNEKISENDILDYKIDFQDETEIIKHCCAFANTRGGYLLFGIDASNDGGPPTEIVGIDRDKIHKERLESMMLSNIVPRLDIKIKVIEQMPKPEKSVLIIQIPDSYNRPHYHQRKNKFYKRYNFQSNEMTEMEIAYMYRMRFSSHEQVDQYVNRFFNRGLDTSLINDIIVIPSNISHRLVDSFDPAKYSWMENIPNKHEYSTYDNKKFFPHSLEPFADGLRCKYWQTVRDIHRNGCLHVRYVSDPSHVYAGEVSLLLINTLYAATKIMYHYNYLGEVKIIMSIFHPKETKLMGDNAREPIDELNARIERIFPIQFVDTNHEEISADIMHELVNHFHVNKCSWFTDDGKWEEQ